ncbi:hypothetical protein [Comamonas antarctica]|uniref:hypothetical protein n=1 Tax=Comamonas antarctica TaxID=2743470 RepID=UPI0028EBFF65|nr:hypothetical protein [Comamonas antarctica]
MSTSRQRGLPALALLAMALPMMEAAQKQRAADPGSSPDAEARNFLAELLAGKCGCPDCKAASRASGESPATDQAAEGNTEAATETAAPQEVVRASGGVSETACRGVGLTDADIGTAAQVKATAAAFITGLEDLRDSLPGGTAERLTAEGHIGAVARACAWAVSLLPKQPS